MLILMKKRPEFALPAYKGLTVQAPSTEVTDHDLEHAREQVLSQRAEFKEVETPAEAGNFVRTNYVGLLDGTPLKETLEGHDMYTGIEDAWEEAGSESGMGISSIAAALVGLQKGDKTEVEHTFAEEFEIEALAGKTVTYKVEVLEVRKRVLPELDEAFLKSLGMDSKDAFEERLREQVSQRKVQQAAAAKRQSLISQLVDATTFHVPDSATARERDDILREYMQQQMNHGVKQEDLEKNKDKLLEDAQEAAQARVKAQFILMEIAREEKIDLKPEDMQQILMQEAMSTQTPPEKLAQSLRKDEGRLRDLQRQGLFAKTLDYLIEQAKVEEVEAAHAH